ncbi:MAG: hypothetical protein Tsb005_19920 [Gammaproteobacteria bacterium]
MAAKPKKASSKAKKTTAKKAKTASATKRVAAKATKKAPTRVKKAATKVVAAKKAPAPKLTVIKDKPLSKTELYTLLAERVGINKKQVSEVFNELGLVIENSIKKGSVGIFTLPGLLKISVVRKPATKARKGINPFTGEETVFKAKPARNVVKIRPLKKAKDMVA